MVGGAAIGCAKAMSPDADAGDDASLPLADAGRDGPASAFDAAAQRDADADEDVQTPHITK